MSSILAPTCAIFRCEFFEWRDTDWLKVSDSNMLNDVVGSLQLDAKNGVTSKFANDVMLNVKSLASLATDAEPPFLVEQERPLIIKPERRIVFRNGTMSVSNLTNGVPELEPHDRRYFSTGCLPYNYDPDAECPRWLQTLHEILPKINDGDNRILVLQEFIGWTLVPGDCQYQKMFILVGDGANGKSLILFLWEAMLGSDNVSHVPLEGFAQEHRLGELEGKLANIAGDMNHIARLAEGLLKQIVSGEPTQVNQKYKDPRTMRSSARLVFSTNNLPPFNDRSDGIWRRSLIMPFNVKFKEKQPQATRVSSPHDGPSKTNDKEADTTLAHRLMAELPRDPQLGNRGGLSVVRPRRIHVVLSVPTHIA